MDSSVMRLNMERHRSSAREITNVNAATKNRGVEIVLFFHQQPQLFLLLETSSILVG